MNSHTLELSASQRAQRRLSATDFLWRPLGEPSSFLTNVSPGLEELTGSQRRNTEFVRLATLVYLADRTHRRPSMGWSRTLELHIPVWDADPWNRAAAELEALLGFLTSDVWRLRFRTARTPRSAQTAAVPQSALFSLFSGGADSLCGALAAHEQGLRPCLVSHRDWSQVAGAQDRLVLALKKLWGQKPSHLAISLGRKAYQLGSGAEFPKEPTSRSRSLLFVSLGLAAASAHDATLWIPENGFASLNPPLGGERRGSLSTRTTHPWYLWRLQQILGSLGAHAKFENPFADLTKGAMFIQIEESMGADAASQLLSSSHSCARGDVRFAGITGVTHCGICFGCLVRRAAFRAAGLKDLTGYVVADLGAPVGSIGGWLTPVRRRDLEAVRYAAARGIDPAVIIAEPLPPKVDPSQAVALAERGLKELAGLVL